MRICFIINSRSYNAASRLKKLRACFGPDASYLMTKFAGHACELGEQAVDEEYTHIVAVGGDGTIHEVVNGIINSKRYEALRPIFTLLPSGSGNDLARTLEFDDAVASLQHRIQRNSILQADIGAALFGNGNQSSVRYFINVMDLGLGGAIAKRVDSFRRSRFAFFAYQRAIFSILPFYRRSSVTVDVDGIRYEGELLSVVIANGKWFGSGLGIAPDALLDDGQLQIVILGRVGILQYLYHLPSIMGGRKIAHKEVSYHTGRHIVVTGDELICEMDGEVAGRGPVEVSVLPGRLRMLR